MKICLQANMQNKIKQLLTIFYGRHKMFTLTNVTPNKLLCTSFSTSRNFCCKEEIMRTILSIWLRCIYSDTLQPLNATITIKPWTMPMTWYSRICEHGINYTNMTQTIPESWPKLYFQHDRHMLKHSVNYPLNKVELYFEHEKHMLNLNMV